MKKNVQRLLTISILTSMTGAGIFAINKLINASAVIRNALHNKSQYFYDWIIFAARPAGTRAVLGGDQPLALEPQQQGIECALGQVGKAAVPQGGGNGIAVGRFPVNDL